MSAEDFLNSDVWVHKMIEGVFKKVDVDNDGYISIEDLTRTVDHYQKALDAHKAALERSNSEIFGDRNRVSKEDWLRKVAEVAAGDLEREKQGEDQILVKTSETFFDLMDIDRDGSVSVHEFKQGMVVSGWDAEMAEQALQAAPIGKNSSGMIGREETCKHCRDFWYKLDQDSEQ